MSLTQKEMVEELKSIWKKLWQERVDDKVRAEGIAKADYSKLFVEKGTIIHATRDYKALNFKEILEQHQIANADRLITPDPQIGGWTKFIKVSITNQRSRKQRRAELYCEENKQKQQSKKRRRGWLHL
jgi:ABC-type sulfate transport system substrate-binding protein